VRAYRFTFDPITGQYKGITRDKNHAHATHEPPIFSYGCQTVWDFKGEWRLVSNERFFDTVKQAGELSLYNYQMNAEIKNLEENFNRRIEHLSERIDFIIDSCRQQFRVENNRHDQVMRKICEFEKDIYQKIDFSREHLDLRILKSQSIIHKEILKIDGPYLVRSLLCAAWTSFSNFSKRCLDSVTSRFKS